MVPFLAFDLEASPTSLLEMVKDDNLGKRLCSEGSNRGSRWLLELLLNVMLNITAYCVQAL
jgi:hypothetical protein